MRARNLDTIYVGIRKCIALVKGHTEIEGIDTLFKMCRLRPYKMVKINKRTVSEKINLYRWWIDEYGNSLRLKGKEPEIVFDDLAINRERLNCTDLYNGLPLHKVFLMSKSMLLLMGKEKGSYQDVCAVSLLGIDDYLRTFVLLDGHWRKFPSLYLGVSLLLHIAGDGKEGAWEEIKIEAAEETIIVPCVQQRAWLSSLPVPEELKQKLSMLPVDIMEILDGEKSING
jgi:hypothetical protein